MIYFHKETDIKIKNIRLIKKWIIQSIIDLNKSTGNINYIFCNDDYLLQINKKHLNHDYYTDIITFDYSENNIISGDIFISTERILENSKAFQTSFKDELHRVMLHGVLHLAGFKDKTPSQIKTMRTQENKYLSLRTF